MTVEASDSFIRLDQGGFGTATGSPPNVWGAPVNGNGTAAIVSNRGVFGNGNLDTQMICGSHAGTTDINMLVKLSTSDLNNVAGILWHYTAASGGSGYRAGFFASNLFVVDKYTNGSRSNVLAHSITAYTTNSDQWIRLIHTNSGTLQIRWWPDGQAEPGDFNAPFVNQSETSYSSGDFGVSVFINSGGTVSYGSFTVTDNASNAIALATHAQTAFKIRASLQTQARSSFKIRAALVTRARTVFKIHAVIMALTMLARTVFKVTDDPGVDCYTRDNQSDWTTRDNQSDWTTRG